MSLITRTKNIGLFYVVVMSMFTSLFAHQITIDPEKYTSSWYASTPDYTRYWGINTIELPTGRHQIKPKHETWFYINIDDAGYVTVENPVCATGGVGQLTFKTVPVNIEVYGFGGRWSGPDDNGYASGSRTLNLVPGVYSHYSLILQHDNPGSNIHFTVGNNGEITVDNADATVVDGNTITFKNATVTIDPQNNKHALSLDFLAQNGIYNRSSFVLPVGLTHRLLVGDRSPLLFTFHANGLVTSLNPDSAEGGQNLLTLKNTVFHLDPQLFEGAWTLGSKADGIYWEYGAKEHVIVPGMHYSLRVMGLNSIKFDLDVNGNVINVEKPESVKGVSNSLVLKNVPLMIDSNEMDTKYVINSIESANLHYSEPMSFTAVPGLRYQYWIDGHQGWNNFSIDANGIVSMEVEQIAITGAGSIQFNISEVFIDPKVYGNLWKILGSTWFEGVQTYKVVTGLDYRVYVYGSNEFDTFFAKEECYTEVQSLNVNGNPFEVSMACTQVTDADEDGIEDDVDNCPMVSNPLQSDFDGDAIGDACDIDMDADSVLKEIDMCQATPLGSIVTSNGCSAFQYVDLNCNDALENHGKYVSCVARSANELVDENVIAVTEKKEFIKAAAKSK